MKKHFISVIATMLIFTMLLVSCGEAAPKTSGESSVSTETAGTADLTTEKKEEVPDIPDISEIDFNGQELNILVWKSAGRNGNSDNDDFFDDVDKETMEGQLIYEAALERQRAIEEKYGVTIITEVTSSNLASKYLNVYKSGDVMWDIISPVVADIPNLIINETLMELGSLDYLDITKAYWDQNVFEGLSIGGKNYMLTGDISTMDEELYTCTAYNLTLGKECGIDPIPYVKDGKWTIDVMGELARKVTKDLNGNGIRDKNDRYGIGHTPTSAYSYVHTAGERFATLDANGVPKITLNSTRAIEMIEKVHALYNDPTAIATIDKGPTKVYASWAELNQAMVDGKFCFRPANIYNLRQYLLMEDDFTVLPMPKLDESQKEYKMRISINAMPAYCVPASTDRTEFISIMLEELAYYGKQFLTPAYYESYLSARIAYDTITAEMFDIIFAPNTKVYDLGCVFDWGGMINAVCNSILNGNPASNIDSVMNAAITAMNETYEAILNATN